MVKNESFWSLTGLSSKTTFIHLLMVCDLGHVSLSVSSSKKKKMGLIITSNFQVVVRVELNNHNAEGPGHNKFLKVTLFLL